MQKGQAIIEFMFLILIVVVYLTTTTLPLIESTQKILMDSENITRGYNETQKIINAVNEVNLFSAGTKQTITLFIPNETKIICNSQKNIVSFETQLTEKPYPIECEEGLCKKELTPNADIFCSIDTIIGPQKIDVLIQKSADGKVEFSKGN